MCAWFGRFSVCLIDTVSVALGEWWFGHVNESVGEC